MVIFLNLCDKCGGLLIPKKSKKTTILECRRCGKKKLVKTAKDFKISSSAEGKETETIVVEKKSNFEVLPKTTMQCPKCEHNEAFWWMQQIRAIDEPATRFYKCTKCKHIWREYE